MNKVANILLVEDDQLDVIDIKRTFDKSGILYNLQVAKNGEEAVDMLRHRESHLLPDIVLIDINMPRMNGLELLHLIRSTEEWKHLKCFIITTSEEKIDKESARSMGISGYIVKPLKLSNNATIDAFNLMIDLLNLK